MDFLPRKPPNNPPPPAMRVLTRPPAPAPIPISSPSDPRPPSPSPQPHPRSIDFTGGGGGGGVVVVGFISRSPYHSSQLINRVADVNAFGSGNLEKVLSFDKEEVKDWFKLGRISYYHDEEKGFLFLHFCPSRCPVLIGSEESGFEFEELQGLLFMFSVCHVMIYVHEGSRIDTHILQKFRVLQAAKHALAPYVKSRTTPPLPSRPHSPSPTSRPSTSSSSGRGGGIMNRNASAISLMSGLGSYTSLFPGHCTPVLLFVFIDDFLDVLNASSSAEESTDASSLNQSSSMSSLGRPNLHTKGSGSVVVLARSVSKSEGGFRKKLQSSLEAQIRFLIKKCRTLSGSETGHASSRSGNVSSTAPLFSLDASRAVVLLDRSTNQRGESLDFATDLVEDVLKGKATSDSLLLESHSQRANTEDILFIKEFIYRQSDILRGRGGLVTGANSGSAAGVGMVAAAAAAAAASAASGKTIGALELPSFELWLSCCQLIIQGIVSAKCGVLDDPEISKRKTRQRNTNSPYVEGAASKSMDPPDIAVSLLESGRGLNTKFSTMWCERNLPTAKDVYLKDLPPCYPTSQHEAHLARSLRAFYSMVRGPAVQLFAKRLEDECTSIWKSGRQLCDAVSLTGKPCMHQIHKVDDGAPLDPDAVKPHSSGCFFLHACACGRSRELRPDPFDFESANNASNYVPDCCKLLPIIHLPEGSHVGPVQSSSWSLIRVGGISYYDPSKGLLQSGFSATHKFLLKWTIFLEKPRDSNNLKGRTLQHVPSTRLGTDLVEPRVETDREKSDASQLHSADAQTMSKNQRNPPESGKYDDKKISFGRGLPNFTLRKPFSEVVAGSSATNSKFPPLQQRKLPALGSEKGIRQNMAKEHSAERVHNTVDQRSQKFDNTSPAQEAIIGVASNGVKDGEPFFQIGTYVVPMSVNGSETVKFPNHTSKHAIVYFGFEHECPHGHRFLLNSDHLNELGSIYSLPEESHVHSAEISGHNVVDSLNFGRNATRGKIHRSSKGMTISAANKLSSADKSKGKGANDNISTNGLTQFSGLGKDQNQMYMSGSTYHNLAKSVDKELHSATVDDDGGAFSLLNRNLPIYMNCPYCRLSKSKKDRPKKFAGTISQLQRIFLVTPPFPVVLAMCPVVQFEPSCLPQSLPDREQKLEFSIGCRVVLPAESFLTLRLPFVYGAQLEDGGSQPLKVLADQPEMTAWIMKGTTLQVFLNGLPDQTKILDLQVVSDFQLTFLLPGLSSLKACLGLEGRAFLSWHSLLSLISVLLQ